MYYSALGFFGNKKPLFAQGEMRITEFIVTDQIFLTIGNKKPPRVSLRAGINLASAT